MTYQPRRPARHEKLRIRDLDHRLTFWGAPSDDPIVLLHGWLDSGDTWQFLVDALPDTWSFVAPDWRGFGGTDWAPGGYWFADYLADLDALLDALVPGKPARVIGHSMGGNVATLYAGVRPERLQWVANLEGVGLRPSPAEEAPARYEQWLDEIRAGAHHGNYGTIEQFAALLRQRNPRLTPDRAGFIARAWSRPIAASSDVTRRGRDHDEGVMLVADPRHRWVNPILYRAEEVDACWKRVKIPLLLLLGELSEFPGRLGTRGTPEFFHRAFVNLGLATVPGVGHMMHHEDPVEVARLVSEFVSSVERELRDRQPVI